MLKLFKIIRGIRHEGKNKKKSDLLDLNGMSFF